MSSDDASEVVVVYVTNDVYEAEILRNELREAGVVCEVDGESQGGFTELVQTKLLVKAQDEDRARRIIGARSQDQSKPPQDEP
jgi:hypothetical protein